MENTENTETALIPTLQLTPFEQTKETLIGLASDYKNMVVTRENLKEANEARLVLYRKRIEIQNVAKANRKTIKDFLKSNNDAIEVELIETIEPTEIALEDKIRVIKYAIEEEERIEQARIKKHQDRLALIRTKTVEVTNSNDIDWLKTWFEENDIKPSLEEFQEEYDQLLSTLKETAKNRLELLEFQAKKKADEELKEKEALAAEIANIESEEKVLNIDAVNNSLLAHRTYSETLLANAANNIDGAILAVLKETPKPSPFKTVPIGAVSEQTTKITDFYKLKHLAEELTRIDCSQCESKEAKQHVEYIKNMLSRLSEQTLKVSEKL